MCCSLVWELLPIIEGRFQGNVLVIEKEVLASLDSCLKVLLPVGK